jgi:hypothetical protein
MKTLQNIKVKNQGKVVEVISVDQAETMADVHQLWTDEEIISLCNTQSATNQKNATRQKYADAAQTPRALCQTAINAVGALGDEKHKAKAYDFSERFKAVTGDKEVKAGLYDAIRADAKEYLAEHTQQADTDAEQADDTDEQADADTDDTE